MNHKSGTGRVAEVASNLETDGAFVTILKTTLKWIIFPTIVGIVVYRINTPKPKLSVFYAFTSQKPYQADSLGQLHLDYKKTMRLDRFELERNEKRKKRVKSAYGLTDIILINNCSVDRLSADMTPLSIPER